MPNKTSGNDPSKRPDPEALLKVAKAEEADSSKGRLKIFLGYSAGVGKTFAMLEMARRLKKDGVDIVIGYVETHKRAETEALLEGLEILPRKAVSYRNTTLYEMDLDAVLNRRPKIAVVDELAHTNVPGSRHTKRYQDIEELLSNGIDVYTTLNIQHIESLNDVIAKVTLIKMHETVPDTILDEADEIEVVDLPIGELIKRLREGKVYFSEQAERALQNYFNEGNLASLRELTLRRAAKRIDTQMQSLLPSGLRSARERLLVCVSSYASSAELVRSAKLLAAGLDAEWSAVYVETGQKLSEEAEDRVTRTLRLAEELGAKPVTLSGGNIAEEVIDYARVNQITKILIGKPLKRRLSDILYGSVVDQLIRLSGEIDVYVTTRSTKREEKIRSLKLRKKAAYGSYFGSVLLVLAATIVSALVRDFLEPANLVMFYLLAVVVSAIYLGRGPSIVAAILSVAAFDFFFVPPFFTFTVHDTQYFLTFLVLFAVGLVISTLTTRIKEQAESARAREAFTASLYGLSRDLAGTTNAEAVSESLSRHVLQTLEAPSVVFLKEGESLKPCLAVSEIAPEEREHAVADWVFKNGEAAGWSTDTLPGSSGYYIPLKTVHGIFGVIGVYFKTKAQTLALDRKRLLEAFTSQSALAIERIRLSEEAQKTKLLEEREKLQSALFNSISHDLRTPLVSITGSLSGMLENLKMDEDSRKDLLENAYEEAGRLNRLVGNLLDMARLEANALKVTPSLCEISDVVGAALKALEERLSDRRVTVAIEKDLPHIPMDFSLMMKVLVNLLDNAVKYAPFGLPIDIEAKKKNGFIEIKVLDRGLGIPERDLEYVFDKFYRVKRPQNIEGTGLGLSICKGIVEAHGGKIWAETRPGGGTIVTLSLPIKL